MLADHDRAHRLRDQPRLERSQRDALRVLADLVGDGVAATALHKGGHFRLQILGALAWPFNRVRLALLDAHIAFLVLSRFDVAPVLCPVRVFRDSRSKTSARRPLHAQRAWRAAGNSRPGRLLRGHLVARGRSLSATA